MYRYKDKQLLLKTANSFRTLKFDHFFQDSENPKMSYVGVALTKDHALVWISHMKILLTLGLEQLSLAGSVSGAASAKKLSAWLSFLVAFTSIKVTQDFFCNYKHFLRLTEVTFFMVVITSLMIIGDWVNLIIAL